MNIDALKAAIALNNQIELATGYLNKLKKITGSSQNVQVTIESTGEKENISVPAMKSSKLLADQITLYQAALDKMTQDFAGLKEK